jgi:hypothetical protein
MQTSCGLARFDAAGFQGSQRIATITAISSIMPALSELLVLLTLLLSLLVQILLHQFSLLRSLTRHAIKRKSKTSHNRRRHPQHEQYAHHVGTRTTRLRFIRSFAARTCLNSSRRRPQTDHHTDRCHTQQTAYQFHLLLPWFCKTLR